MHYCSIILLVMPALAASPPIAERTTTVVRVDEKSGHLVRSVAVEPRLVNPNSADRAAPPVSEPAPVEVADVMQLIASIAADQGVEEALVHSVIRAESNYNARAVSPKGPQ